MPSLIIEIVLQDQLNERDASWFQGFEVEPCADHATRVRGQVPDHSALHGLLERIRDLNLHLVSVQVNPESTKGN